MSKWFNPASHVRTTSCCSTSARYPTLPPLQDVGYWGSIASMSSRTISRPSINFNTSPYPPCTFYQTFPKRLRYSQPFDIPSHDCPSNMYCHVTTSALVTPLNYFSRLNLFYLSHEVDDNPAPPLSPPPIRELHISELYYGHDIFDQLLELGLLFDKAIVDD